MFKKAERKRVKLKLALAGVSGSGKTYSALRLARGMGGKIAVIDTENDSASLYADKFDFDVCPITPPFTSEKYIEAINAAVKAGYDVVVVDSLSHAWAGEGGVLDYKNSLDRSGKGNSFTNWGDASKKQDRLTNTLLQAPVHIIVTMRSKQEYVQQEDDKGRKQIKKLGLAPVQRDGLEYEFTMVLEVSHDHLAVATKNRTSLFGELPFQVNEGTGEKLIAWLNSAKPEDVAEVKTEVEEPGPASAFIKSLEEKQAKNPSEDLDVNHSEYVIPLGEFKGLKLTDIDKDKLASYYARLESSARGKQLSAAQDQLMLRISNYLM